jgi:hypothetical protein
MLRRKAQGEIMLEFKMSRPTLFFLAFAIGCSLTSEIARADESGVSFWIPGFFGSLAATPQQPGFSLATINYYTSVSAGRNIEFQHGGAVFAGVDANVDIGLLIPSFVFADPVLGGQLSATLVTMFGHNETSASAEITGPMGGVISGGRTDQVTGVGDLVPQMSLRWNFGVNNFMTYITGDAPVGNYDPQRIANLGLGHGAVDAGGGYTYFNPQKGQEFSAVGGFTYNLINPQTNVQSGVDFHLDWAASQFITQQVQVGIVGYAYDQVTGDSGSGDLLGPFESRVFGVGPQLGFVFPAGDYQAYVNLKAYKEFDAADRPSGANVWLTLAFTPSAHNAAPPVVAKY